MLPLGAANPKIPRILKVKRYLNRNPPERPAVPNENVAPESTDISLKLISSVPLSSAVVTAQPFGIYKRHPNKLHRLADGTNPPNHVDFDKKPPDSLAMNVSDAKFLISPLSEIRNVNGPENFEPSVYFAPKLPLAGKVL